jgi:hypothetical protein
VVRPVSRGVPRAPRYSGTPLEAYWPISHKGLSPALAGFSKTVLLSAFGLKAPATPGRSPVWAVPLSLAATDGINVFFFSCRYLDVSVPCVRSVPPMHSAAGGRMLPRPGFPIQKSRDRRLFASFSGLIAGFHVFRRLSMPRHPPYALSNLTTFIDHRGRKLRFAICDLRIGLANHPSPAARSTFPTGRGETVCRHACDMPAISRGLAKKGARQLSP